MRQVLGVAVAMTTVINAAAAPPPWRDADPSCAYLSAPARQDWMREGGDWVDANHKPYGDTPFATQRWQAREAGLSLDVLALATAWRSGRADGGALWLQSDGGSLRLASRESSGGHSAVLNLVWDDGQRQELRASADALLACPTQRPLGERPDLLLTSGRRALVAFPFIDRPGRSLREARLRLDVLAAKGRGQLQVFGVLRPYKAHVAAPGLSDGLDRDRGLAALPGVLLQERFENTALAREWSTEKSPVQVTQQGVRPVDGSALRVTVPRGVHTGLQRTIKLAPLNGGREPEEAFFRYHLWLDSSWDPLIDGGKMPGFAGTYGQAGWGGRKSDGENGWSARGAFMKAYPGNAGRAFGNYVYTADQDDRTGAQWGWNLGSTGWLTKQRWVAIEQQLRLNTPGRSDGLLRVWINGGLVFEKQDIRWRNNPALRIETLWMNVYHGGTAVPDKDLVLFIDNLVIADRYIGPGRFPALGTP